MAASGEHLLQMVSYLHAGSQVKPQTVKIRMQMRAGKKGNKNNERWSLGVLFALDKNWFEKKQSSV